MPALAAAAGCAAAPPWQGGSNCLRAPAAWRRSAQSGADAAPCSRHTRPRAVRSADIPVARAASSRGESPITWPCSHWFLRRATLTRTASPGRAPSMNTTLPLARCATPWPSRSSDSTSSHSSLSYMAPIIGSASAAKDKAARRRLVAIDRRRSGRRGVVGHHLPLAIDDLRQPRRRRCPGASWPCSWPPGCRTCRAESSSCPSP